MGSRGKAPGRGLGGSAPGSSWVLAYLKCPERISLTLFFFEKMIDGTPKTGKSTLGLCHNISSTQQTKEIICLHGKRFGDCLWCVSHDE